jgi:hypothetical protein
MHCTHTNANAARCSSKQTHYERSKTLFVAHRLMFAPPQSATFQLPTQPAPPSTTSSIVTSISAHTVTCSACLTAPLQASQASLTAPGTSPRCPWQGRPSAQAQPETQSPHPVIPVPPSFPSLSSSPSFPSRISKKPSTHHRQTSTHTAINKHRASQQFQRRQEPFARVDA